MINACLLAVSVEPQRTLKTKFTLLNFIHFAVNREKDLIAGDNMNRNC